jgi:hypothetical protein
MLRTRDRKAIGAQAALEYGLAHDLPEVTGHANDHSSLTAVELQIATRLGCMAA